MTQSMKRIITMMLGLSMISLILFSTLYSPKTSYKYIAGSASTSSKTVRLFKDLAIPMAPPKDPTNATLTVHPFCPNLQARERRRHNTYEDHIPSHVTWTSLPDMTHPNFTTFHIVQPNRDNFTNFHVCDELRLSIQARNGRNENKTYGGDYFRAKIYTKNSTFKASSMTDGEVVDHGNGSYTAIFTLKWAGVVGIKVTLVHASEANYVLRRLQREEVVRAHFSSKFYTDDAKKAEKTYCNLHLNSLNESFTENETCNFTDATTGTPWFCVKPKNYSCSDQVLQHIENSIDIKTTTTEQLAFTWNDQQITGSINSIVVHHLPGEESIVHMSALDRLPSCKPMVHFGQPEVAGFYWGKFWHSAGCRIRQFSNKSASKVLKNKTVYFFGDSTIRQLFQFYTMLFKLKTKPPKKNTDWYTGPTLAKDKKNNIDLIFQFHGNPIGRGSWYSVSKTEYIANLIDQIEGGENTVVVLTLWAHFGPFPPWYYERRVHDVMESVRRLHERCPRCLVVWKSANTREHRAIEHYLRYSDWTARDLDRRMRNEVLTYGNVGFMDAWDMTNAQFDKAFVHPKDPHVENLSNQLLSYVLNHKNSTD